MKTYDRVVALALKGKPPAEIAQETGVVAGTVRRYLSDARSKGVDVPIFRNIAGRTPRMVNLALHRDVLKPLKDAAHDEGETTQHLAERLLAQIAKHGLVDVVLNGGRCR